MTLNNLLSQLEDALVDSSGEIYEWLENHHIDRDEAIALHDEIELNGKVEEEWEVYEALLMYIDYGREWVVEWLKDNKIKGLGISINEKNLKEYAKCDWLWRESNNIVLHVIEGIVDYYDFDSELCKLQNEYGFIPKVLILGWKDFGRFGDMSNDIIGKRIRKIIMSYAIYFVN